MDPPFSWRLRSTKNQYFLMPEHQKSIFSIPEHQKSIFSVPGAPKINIFYPLTIKNEYFLSLEHQKSIFSIPEHQKSIFFRQYLLSPEHHNSIFSLRIRLTHNQTPSAVAGTQLCCALDKIVFFGICLVKNIHKIVFLKYF